MIHNIRLDYDVNDPWAEDRLEAMRQLMPSSPTKKIEAGNLHESLSNIEQDPSIVDSGNLFMQ